MKRLLFIVNPKAGMRRMTRNLLDVIDIFNRADYEVITYITSGQGDAVEVTAARAADVDLVVCAGGDGTFNETITGILRSGCGTPVGYIPCGSTNDFAASLHLPTNILQAARQIVQGTPVSYDVGQFGDRYFSYVASFGAFTKASYATPQDVKNALGHTAYILEGIQELSQIRAEHVRIELDDGVIEDDFLFGAISNSTSVGGILTLDPKQVDMQDGKFELLLVRAPVTAQEIGECIHALRTQKYNCSMITFLSSHQMVIHASPDMPWTLDGEREDGHSEVAVRNLHNAISLMKKE
ncbi:MAG: YegS/Rv2252/BmrU family lipid kinase [Firmicutes bacterium]|nr:YegS/Rv2252/BmrU family lipid kinase [Bacillota bacterium]